MTYRVSTTPAGEKRWWMAGEAIPADHTGVRPACADEAEIMDEILRQDAQGRMPDLMLGARVTALMNQQ